MRKSVDDMTYRTYRVVGLNVEIKRNLFLTEKNKCNGRKRVMLKNGRLANGCDNRTANITALWLAGLTVLLQGQPLCLGARIDVENGPFGFSAGHKSSFKW